MAWKLTHPVNVGDMDPAGNYGETKIMRFTTDTERGMFVLELSYGNTVNGKWVRGLNPVGKQTSPVITEQDFVDLVTANKALWDQVAAVLYNHLASKNVIGPGVVE